MGIRCGTDVGNVDGNMVVSRPKAEGDAQKVFLKHQIHFRIGVKLDMSYPEVSSIKS